MEAVVRARSGVPIRLTDERWTHIADQHRELAAMRHAVLETVRNPARVFQGNGGELLAVREVERGKSIVARNREVTADDGFVITAFLTRRWNYLERRPQTWPPAN